MAGLHQAALWATLAGMGAAPFGAGFGGGAALAALSNYRRGGKGRSATRKMPMYRNRISRKPSIDYHCYRHTTGPTSIPFKAGTTGIGFDLPGSSGTLNNGLLIYYQPNLVTIVNGAGGSLTTAVGNSTQYAAIYDFYRIKKVTVKCFFSGNASQTQQSGVPHLPMPILQYVFDSNGFSAPGNSGIIPDYASAKVKQFGNGASRDGSFSFSCRPKYSEAVGNTLSSSVVASAQSASKDWISTTATGMSLPHYGQLMWMDPQGSNAAVGNLLLGNFTLYFTMELEFKGVR